MVVSRDSSSLRDHRPREGVVREVDECAAAPQCERVAQRRRRRLGVARVERGAAFRREPVETGRVERVVAADPSA